MWAQLAHLQRLGSHAWRKHHCAPTYHSSRSSTAPYLLPQGAMTYRALRCWALTSSPRLSLCGIYLCYSLVCCCSNVMPISGPGECTCCLSTQSKHYFCCPLQFATLWGHLCYLYDVAHHLYNNVWWWPLLMYTVPPRWLVNMHSSWLTCIINPQRLTFLQSVWSLNSHCLAWASLMHN